MSATRSLEVRGTLLGEAFEVELLSAPDLAPSERNVADGIGAIEAAFRTVPEGTRRRLAADHPLDHDAPLPEALADAAGFTHRRDLLLLQRNLPVEPDHPARTNHGLPIRPIAADGSDDDAWIRCNNRAFEGHADQGHQTRSTLHAQRAEPWYDRIGFLVLDDPARPGELAGFCWTKVHDHDDDQLRAGAGVAGEIYVIGVDPARTGEGLGATLVLAGLDHLAAAGADHGILFVDSDNEPARRLYARLGFAATGRRRVYTP